MANAGSGKGLLSDPQYVEGPRHPIVGAALQRRGGTAHHDAVAWGYARRFARGVDMVQNCEVKGIRRDAAGAVSGVETSKGFIATKKIAAVAAGHTSTVMGMAGVRMPWRAIRCRRWFRNRSSR